MHTLSHISIVWTDGFLVLQGEPGRLFVPAAELGTCTNLKNPEMSWMLFPHLWPVPPSATPTLASVTSISWRRLAYCWTLCNKSQSMLADFCFWLFANQQMLVILICFANSLNGLLLFVCRKPGSLLSLISCFSEFY